jgi:hypothetical protein
VTLEVLPTKFWKENNMATADEYAKWIVDNSDKKGTPDFDTVAKAYQEAKTSEAKPLQGFSATKMIQNAPASLYRNTIGGLIEAASSPLQTATGLMDIAAGGLQNLTPKALRDIVNQANVGGSFLDPEAAKRAQTLASAVGQDYATTYGTGAGFKKTMQEDPFRVLGDVSLLATGGAAATSRLPAVSNVLAKTAQITNPINALIKSGEIAGKLVPQAMSSGLGLGTGVGSETVKTAFTSGLKGKEAFKANMRGEVPITQVLDDAKSNLAAMNAAKQTDYRSGMLDIAKDKTILKFNGIDNALAEAEKFSKFKGKVINETADNLLTSIKNTIDDWKQSDPVNFHTPEGLDQLKQAVWGHIEKLPMGSKQAYSAGKKIYDSIKTEIGNQAPTYAKVMKDYSEASDLVHEIERALSLGQKASADTALRKLQSLTRDNVTTNYGGRTALAQQLAAQGGNDLMPALAGQAMSTFTPRNLAGQGGAVAAGLGAFSNPAMLAALPFMSPRLVGEAAYGVGNVGRIIGETGAVKNYLSPTIANANRLRGQIPMTAEQARTAALIAAQTGQTPYRVELSNMASGRP